MTPAAQERMEATRAFAGGGASHFPEPRADVDRLPVRREAAV